MADFPGTVGDDLIDGTATADTIGDGGGGNDTLNGGDGDDVITTSGGNDTISGGAGTDRLIIDASVVAGTTISLFGDGSGSLTSASVGNFIGWTGIENISYTGGTGFDRLTLSGGNHIVSLGNADDILTVGDGTLTADGGFGTGDGLGFQSASSGVTWNLASGIIAGATLTGTAVNFETASGSAFNDVLVGGTTTNQFFGGGGDDILDTGTRVGSIILSGNTGNDIFIVRNGAIATVSNFSTVGVGHDRVETDIANFTLTDGVEDLEYFGTAAFTGTGNSVANVIVGGAMGDTLTGLGGDDTVGGEGGDDILDGGEGNDRLNGGTGADSMSGGAGNDILVVDNGGDVANGGDGSDTVQIVTAGLTYTVAADIETVSNHSGGALTITLNALANSYGGSNGVDAVNGGDGNDTLYGLAGGDNLTGGAGIDRLFGDAGNDFLFGGDGNDLLYGGFDSDGLSGGTGNDTLYAGDGADNLLGGFGVDMLYGGTGADIFTFGTGDSGATLATADRILDFSLAQNDRINVALIDAIAGGGDEAFSFIGTAAFDGIAGQLRYQQVGGNTQLMGDVNGDGVADFIIRIDGLHALTAGNFTL